MYFIQEAKLTQDKIDAMQTYARKKGWRAFALPCTTGDGGRPSCGVVTLVKSYFDIDMAIADIKQEVVPHRVMAIPARFKTTGVIVFYNIYLKSSVGLDDFNRNILNITFRHIMLHGLPFVICGDCNIPPWLCRNMSPSYFQTP